MTELIRYDAACRAIAEAKAIDEVRDIRNKADALRLYLRQAGNRAAEIQMAEIRFRAERRIGEIKLDLRASGRLHEGGRPKTSSEDVEVSKDKIRLKDLGIDDHLSLRAEKFALYEPDAYERLVKRWRDYQEKESNRVSLNLLKEDQRAKDTADFVEQTKDGCTVDDLHELAASGWKAGAILTDPPWKFLTRSAKGQGRSPKYRTDPLATIKALPVPQLAAADSICLIWCVDWLMPGALEVMASWQFEFKTVAFTWAKQNASGDGWHMGQGFWTRANPEMCLLGTRGHPKRLNADVRQLIVAPVMEHSRKPDEIHDAIERLVRGPYLELYARRERDNWKTWGNQIARVAFEIPIDAAGNTFDHDSDGVVTDGAVPRPENPAPDSGNLLPKSICLDDLDLPDFLRRVSA